MRIVKSLLFPILTTFSLQDASEDKNNCVMPKIAVLGGGLVGSTLAKALFDSNQDVVIAARDPTKTKGKLAEDKFFDITVEASSDALKSADVVILATPGISEDDKIEEFAKSLGDMSGKIIMDATNPLDSFAEGLNVRWGKTTSSGEVLAKALPTAKVYKAFSTVGVEHMKSALGKDMLFAGDADEESLKIATDVIKSVGFKPFYVGPIRYARNLEALAELYIHMVVPSLGARTASRNFWFSISGDP